MSDCIFHRLLSEGWRGVLIGPNAKELVTRSIPWLALELQCFNLNRQPEDFSEMHLHKDNPDDSDIKGAMSQKAAVLSSLLHHDGHWQPKGGLPALEH